MIGLFLSPIRALAASLFIFICVCAGLTAEETHTVQKGETLYSIGRAYGLTVDELCRANGIASDSLLQAGQKLSIPDKTAASSEGDTYTVQKGDTLFSLARSFGMSVGDLQSYNNLSSPDSLRAGQTLKIPPAGLSVPMMPPIDISDLSRVRPVSAKKGDSSLKWPVQSPDVYYLDGKISGVQLSASASEPVRAIAGGTILFSGLYRGFGEVVFVKSPSDHIYVYAGLDGVQLAKGEQISAGNTLGRAGRDAISGKNQLTFMVFKNGVPIDPAQAPRD